MYGTDLNRGNDNRIGLKEWELHPKRSTVPASIVLILKYVATYNYTSGKHTFLKR